MVPVVETHPWGRQGSVYLAYPILCYWWPGDARKRGVSDYGIDIIISVWCGFQQEKVWYLTLATWDLYCSGQTLVPLLMPRRRQQPGHVFVFLKNVQRFSMGEWYKKQTHIDVSRKNNNQHLKDNECARIKRPPNTPRFTQWSLKVSYRQISRHVPQGLA